MRDMLRMFKKLLALLLLFSSFSIFTMNEASNVGFSEDQAEIARALCWVRANNYNKELSEKRKADIKLQKIMKEKAHKEEIIQNLIISLEAVAAMKTAGDGASGC